MLRSLFSAFLMYSRIPAPKVEWKEENRRYALGFFPLVGAVIGGLLMLWRLGCGKLGFGQLVFAAGAVFIPVLVTGGIHLDGFCDVCDARASYADKAKRLEIMSCSTLRQKIAKMILFSIGGKAPTSVSMSRQEMADFLNTARPSLSRELMRMQNDGLITVEGRKITVRNKSALEELLN